VVTLGGKRVYISGDTEDTPEMRALKNIDVALLCMNLPYTMTVEQAGRSCEPSSRRSSTPTTTAALTWRNSRCSWGLMRAWKSDCEIGTGRGRALVGSRPRHLKSMDWTHPRETRVVHT